jgi:ADP-ribose pyrophosphatase
MSTQVHHQNLIHQGRVFKVVQETITLPNGKQMKLDMIRHPGAAAMVPLTRNRSVIMLQQYRHAAGGTIWEIPAGTLDPDESPILCAQRELTEETGYQASAWHPLGEITPVPGYSDERIHIFLAEELTLASQKLDADEILEVHEIEFSTALDMIFNGVIQDAKSICGLLMANAWLQQRK